MRTPRPSATSSRTSCSSSAPASTAPSGSTWASTRTRSAAPASSTRVDDTMESILTLAKTEGMLFKFGSGAGSNLSTIRSQQGDPARRRRGQRPGQLHEGLRRLRRRHQVRRQDPTGREDGHPQRGPSRHRAVHRLQARGGEEGLGADRRRLRRELQRRRGVRIGLLPELEQLRARDRCLHGGGRAGRGLDHARHHHRRAGRDGQGPLPDEQDGGGRLGLRRPGDPVPRQHQPMAHQSPTRRRSTPATRAASTCTSTTRPATWPA